MDIESEIQIIMSIAKAALARNSTLKKACRQLERERGVTVSIESVSILFHEIAPGSNGHASPQWCPSVLDARFLKERAISAD